MDDEVENGMERDGVTVNFLMGKCKRYGVESSLIPDLCLRFVALAMPRITFIFGSVANVVANP